MFLREPCLVVCHRYCAQGHWHSYHAGSRLALHLLAQVLEEECAQLRAELGLDPAAGPLPEEAPRFSKRARQMAPETELESDAAVFLQEAHAAHLRCALIA